MSVEDVVTEYYDALRDGDPLDPFFLDEEAAVKVGVSETLFGYDELVEGLREQTRTTDEWTVESERIVVDERQTYAVFADEVDLAWTDRATGERYRFDTRWTGTLERVDGSWRFVSMHVSAPQTL